MRIDYRSVPCPKCGAAIDEPCLKDDGTPETGVHVFRVRDAMLVRIKS